MLTKFPFAKLIAAFCLGAISGASPLEADAITLNDSTEVYWGKILNLSNNGIRFQVECTGKTLELKWKGIHDPVVFFSSGCRPVDIINWGGEPQDCRETGARPPFRLFEYGNTVNEDYFLHIDYDDQTGILTLENTLKKTARELRAGQFSLWMVCDVKR